MDAYSINKKLIRLHGRDINLNLPKWRVVRSELQTEKREGEYNVFYGDIFVRTEKGIREVMKYYYLKPCWVLEKLCVVYTKSDFAILDKSHTYEPLYTFLDKNDKPLPLAWRAVEFIIGTYNRAEKLVSKNTEIDDLAIEEKKFNKEVEKTKEILFGNESDVTSALTYKEGIVVPSTFEKKDKETHGSAD